MFGRQPIIGNIRRRICKAEQASDLQNRYGRARPCRAAAAAWVMGAVAGPEDEAGGIVIASAIACAFAAHLLTELLRLD